MAKRRSAKEPEGRPKVRTKVFQSDVPFYSLLQAVRVPQAIADSYACRPVRPMQLAAALGVQPTTGAFRMLCGSALAWGLTDAGYNSDSIAITQLAKRIVSPTKEGDDAAAMREAVLKPRVPREFLQNYDQSKLPREDIACNVLVDLGVARDQAKRVFDLIVECARTVGFLREISGQHYVDLQGTIPPPKSSGDNSTEAGEESEELGDGGLADGNLDGFSENPVGMPPIKNAVPEQIAASPIKSSKVFISHGKNMDIVQQVKTMLNVAEIEYEIAVEEESTAIPVPDKVMSAMRRCTAAIICVTRDVETPNHVPQINQNVLIEIGSAFVLYEKRVILLWEKGLPVPSNLQGLYRCEFEGKEISWSAGMKLMEAIKKFRAETK